MEAKKIIKQPGVESWANRVVGARSELVLVLSLVGILLVLFTPIPPFILDFLLILNFSFGMLILLMTLYTDKPLGFSTFPTLLLIATLFRLSLNIASTRLILSEGHAGEVISAVGEHVVEGNYVIGLVVFFILIIVQYVVVTNGAQRVAEVAARFTLDSMPGKQMSIDADMNMGLIDESEARDRRKNIEREANFYGAMDGASKFVKGDAIAGILIILINIIGGLTIGVAQLGLAWGDALHVYTLLTVGDGIVTQIPALVIATATGIIVTRAATDAHLGDEITRQITRYPKSLIMVGFGLVCMLFLPGIPTLPVLLIIAVVSLLAYFAFRENAEDQDVKGEEQTPSETLDEQDLYEKIDVDAIEILVGNALAPVINSDSGPLIEKVKVLREQLAFELGFVFPSVRIKAASSLRDNEYEFRIAGGLIASSNLYPDKFLAISASLKSTSLEGIETRDPSYGLPAIWISENARDQAKDLRYTIVEPLSVLATHFSEVIRNNAHELLNRVEVEQVLRRVKERHSSLYEELVPNILSVADIQKVLQLMLREKVSIKPINTIFEALVDAGRSTKDPESLVEFVRQRCGRLICDPLLSKDGSLQVLTMDPGIEHTLQSGLRTNNNQTSVLIDPGVAERMIKSVAKQTEKMMSDGLRPVLLCSPSLRRHVKKLVERVLPHLNVLSLNEIPSSIKISSFAVVDVEHQKSRVLQAIAPESRE